MDSKLLALIATLAIATTTFTALNEKADGLQSSFQNWKKTYSKSYTPQEEAYRFAVYVQNMEKIAAHNAKNLGWVEGENQFTDLTREEFLGIYATAQADKHKVSKNVLTSQKHGATVNWVTKGDVQKVKNQGSCGSCWAFSTVAALESADAVFKGHLGDFSEQQLVDCSTANNGCGGGMPSSADQYLEQAGICTEASYPYQGVNGTCKASTCTKSTFTIASYNSVQQGDTNALMAACDKQPVSICVACQAWMNYKSGILSNCPGSMDHCVLLAGYVQGSYWLIKNSWGTSFGINGYIKLANPANTCLLANYATTPVPG